MKFINNLGSKHIIIPSPPLTFHFILFLNAFLKGGRIKTKKKKCNACFLLNYMKVEIGKKLKLQNDRTSTMLITIFGIY